MRSQFLFKLTEIGVLLSYLIILQFSVSKLIHTWPSCMFSQSFVTCLTLIAPTGWDQRWPRQLWHQILKKCFCTVFKKITYSCRNILRIFLNFRQDVKNVVLTSVFLCIFVKNLVTSWPCWTPSFRLVLLLLQSTQVWKKSRWAVVRCLVQR